MDQSRRIGWIGLGKMGFPMASNLLEQGQELHIFDVNPEPCLQLAQKGASVSDSIAALAEHCDIVASIVPDDRAVESVAP